MIKVTPIEPAGRDERGFTAEYLQDHSGTQLIIFRKAGSISGRHYHKGISPTKDPETQILLNGTCTYNWKHIDDAEIKTEVHSGPTRIEIPANIWHELIPVTDCTFIEMNSIAEHAADTFRLDED